jgi:crossover junction endodeoxyribonuclease RuvC
MIILGIDPGTATTGYGLIEDKKGKMKLIVAGTIETKAGELHYFRLLDIFKSVVNLIKNYHPDTIAVEEIFFFKNVKTATKVGEARGVILLAAASEHLPIAEYTPLQVKQALVGYGRAEKIQVQKMVKVILNLDQIPKSDDLADALAVAICHSHSYSLTNNFKC